MWKREAVSFRKNWSTLTIPNQTTTLVQHVHMMLKLHHWGKIAASKLSKAQEEERQEGIHRHKCSRYAVQSDETTVCTRNWLDVFDVNPLNLHYFMAVFREANKKKMRIVGGWPYWSNTQQVKWRTWSRIIVNIQLRKVMNQQRISFTSSIVIHIE